jgi:GNAT superfamily N-acetyltransferase
MIRPATRQDIPAILALGQAMHNESRYRVMPWDADKVAGLVDWLIDNADGLAIVCEYEGRVIGGLLGVIEPHFFSTATLAQEYGVFVAPAARGLSVGEQLYTYYTAWARARGAVMIQAGVTTGKHHDAVAAVLGRLGYAEVGQLYEFKGGDYD